MIVTLEILSFLRVEEIKQSSHKKNEQQDREGVLKLNKTRR